MTDRVTITLSGDRDLVKAFKELRNDLGPKYLRAAVRAGARQLELLIKALAPEDTGRLVRNISVKTRKTRETVRGRVVVQKRGKKDDPSNAYYWFFVERGHRVGTRKTGYLRKRDRPSGGFAGPTSEVPPVKFVERAWHILRERVAQSVINTVEKTIDRAAARQRRRVRR